MDGWASFRLVARLAAIGVWTAGLFFVRCLSLPVAPVWRRGEEWWRRLLLHTWASGVSRIAGMRVTVIGRAPKPPYYLVTNHLTTVDIVLLSRTAGCVFVSRADVEHMGALGLMAKGLNTLFIDRAKVRDTRRVNELIHAALDKGYGVHFFAEGGISTDGEVHPFKPSLLEPAVQRGIPVHYAAISYRTPEGCARAKDAIVWGEGVSLRDSVFRVLRLPSFDASIRFGDAPMTAPDRKQLAAMLHKATLDIFTPLG